jgi:hypothetical protein
MSNRHVQSRRGNGALHQIERRRVDRSEVKARQRHIERNLQCDGDRDDAHEGGSAEECRELVDDPLVSRRLAAMLGVHFGDGCNCVFDMRGHDGGYIVHGSLSKVGLC